MSRNNHSGRTSGRQSASTTRSALIMTAAVTHEAPKVAAQRTENTYNMDPERCFPVIETKALVESVLEAELKDREYDAQESNKWALELANQIKLKIKGLGHRRYRIITFVAIGEKQEATINVASRCVWNKQVDQFVEGTYLNPSLYAVGLVYAIYQE